MGLDVQYEVIDRHTGDICTDVVTFFETLFNEMVKKEFVSGCLQTEYRVL